LTKNCYCEQRFK